MKVLALIPARGGSKRLSKKNIKPLDGLPLIAWTIRAARESLCCCDILVSTDDPITANIARQYGATVPWLRPPELSTDSATSVDVAIHALDTYEAQFGAVDALLFLQPTSPFRTKFTISRAIDVFEIGARKYPVVSVSPAECHPAWCFRANGDRIEPYLGWSNIATQSQALELVWQLNGSIYLISPNDLRTKRTFLSPGVIPLFVSEFAESIDIDTRFDWLMAEAYLRGERGERGDIEG